MLGQSPNHQRFHLQPIILSSVSPSANDIVNGFSVTEWQPMILKTVSPSLGLKHSTKVRRLIICISLVDWALKWWNLLGKSMVYGGWVNSRNFAGHAHQVFEIENRFVTTVCNFCVYVCGMCEIKIRCCSFLFLCSLLVLLRLLCLSSPYLSCSLFLLWGFYYLLFSGGKFRRHLTLWVFGEVLLSIIWIFIKF